MNDVTIEKARVPVPRNPAEWVRKLKGNPTLNDQVEVIHQRLTDNNEYALFLDAIYDEQAVEGSLSADDLMAAKLIRDEALEAQNVYVARQKLATLAKSLRIVLKRYGMSRKERRYTVDGEQVPAEDGNHQVW